MSTPETQEKKTKAETVRVYNKGARSFLHGDHKLDSGSFAEVPVEVAAVWRKMFPLDVIEAQQAHKELGGLGAELAETKAELAEAQKRIEELGGLGAELAKTKAKLAEAQKRIEELEKAAGGKGKKASDAV